MTEKTPVPSIAFDPATHVIAGRNVTDGRQQFFSLASIAEAGRQLPTTTEQPSPTAGITFDDLAAFEERIVKAARAAAPPIQFPAEIMATVGDMTRALVAITQRIEALEKDSRELGSAAELYKQNFAALKAITGGGA